MFFGVRQSSLSIILKKFLLFGKLSHGDSYKKDSYIKKCVLTKAKCEKKEVRDKPFFFPFGPVPLSFES